MRIVTLLAGHGAATRDDGLHDVRTFFAHRMPEVAHETVVIDGALQPSHRERAGSDAVIIGGDGVAREFSAWDRGVAWLEFRLDDYDFVHLAVAGAWRHSVPCLDRFDADMLGLVRGRAAAVGHVEFHDQAVVLFGRAMRSWLCSSFVFLPAPEIRLLGSLVSVTNRSALFSGDPTEPFQAAASLSVSCRAAILDRLAGEGTAGSSRPVLSRQTLGRFEDRVIAVLNEMMLTSRLQAQGCSIVDATWLAARAETPRLDGRRPGVLLANSDGQLV